MGNVHINDKLIVFDDKFSQKDFTGKTVVIPDSAIIYQSCFAQETPDSIVFPDKMQGVTFYNCNLDNCLIPPGNVTVECSQNRYQAQSDGQDWIVDLKGNPIQPLNPPSDEDIPVDTTGGPVTSIPVTLNNQVLGSWVWVPDNSVSVSPNPIGPSPLQ